MVTVDVESLLRDTFRLFVAKNLHDRRIVKEQIEERTD